VSKHAGSIGASRGNAKSHDKANVSKRPTLEDYPHMGG